MTDECSPEVDVALVETSILLAIEEVRAKDICQRRDAVAGIDAIFVADDIAWRVGRVIIHVKHMNCRAVEQLEPFEIGAAFVQVVDVWQHASLGMSAFDGHLRGLSKPLKGF